VNYFTNELSKESHVDKQGAMVSTDGKVVKTQMEEVKVAADGKLLSRSGDATVKTMPSLAKIALASSLPDATLMALDEITVHSDKGYTLQIKVHGFSRVPVLNSRCGNIVHFYTAWKGKVTLDSTDLSFDEATAAEFKTAGFSLATGGRRLAGKITVDGFAKALDGMREGGRWTCAGVPLPTFSELGDRKETSYSACGTRHDKDSICYSKWGGLKVGVTALEGSLAAAVTSLADRLKGKQTEKLFVKSSSAVMNSDLYRVSFSEYAMHPGQQLVAISDLASGKEVRFQMEMDKTRSHCVVANDRVQQSDQQAKKSVKIDSEWHFEYLGTNEEDGRVLRQFRIMLGSEYTKFIFGDASKASLANFAEFWDVAETMQPQLLVLGGGAEITVFDSYMQVTSDVDVQAAVKTRTGKTVTELMKCSDVEATRETPRHVMDPFMDLSRQDADYYGGSSARKSKTFARYLDAAGSSFSLPDVCYESCKTAVDELKLQGRDICEGAARDALLCLQETGKAACSASEFSDDLSNHCYGTDTVSNNTVRTLTESETESEDALELINETHPLLAVNETPRAVSKRNLLLTFKCPKFHYSKIFGLNQIFIFQADFRPEGYKYLPGEWRPYPEYDSFGGWGASFCSKWEMSDYWKSTYFGGDYSGSLTLAFRSIRKEGLAKHGLAVSIKCTACADVAMFFGIPPPLEMQACFGGGIQVDITSPCPTTGKWEFLVTFFGYMSWSLTLSLDFWIGTISFASLTLGVSTGYKKVHIRDGNPCQWKEHGWFKKGKGYSWLRRRRRQWVCTYKEVCDTYFKGYIKLQILWMAAEVDFAYYSKNKILSVTLKLYGWAFKWYLAYANIIYEKKFV